MLGEPAELAAARRHLAAVESDFLSLDAEFHLTEGLDSLEMLAGETSEAAPARRIGATYLSRFRQRLWDELAAGDIAEPTLKLLLSLSRVLDGSAFTAQCDVSSPTGAIADRLVDALLEGYPDDERERLIELAHQRLME